MCLCACCYYGRISSEHNGANCCLECVKFFLCMPFCYGCLLHKKTRSHFRYDFALAVRALCLLLCLICPSQEICCNDRCTTCFCGPCALCQEVNERENRRGMSYSGFMAGPTRQEM